MQVRPLSACVILDNKLIYMYIWVFGIRPPHFIFIYVPVFLFLSSLLSPPPLLPLSLGKYIIEGQMLRAKAQLDQLHSNIASVARKTGISSATKLALLGPSREGREEDIPLVEWWDAAILPNRR